MLESSPNTATLPGDLAQRMIPVIRRIAHQLAKRLPKHIYVDDLIGAGLLGLVTAYSRFDPSRGGGFQAYAEARIRGAMLDELRATDPLSRDQRSHVTRRAAATRALQARLGRAPEAEEIAAELGMSIEDYWERMTATTTGALVNIDGNDDEDGAQLPQHDAESADDHLSKKQAQVALKSAIATLPPRLLRVLELHYCDGLTLREIGESFGVSESRVCQLQSEAIRILRERCRQHAETREPEPPKAAVKPRRRALRVAARAEAQAAA